MTTDILNLGKAKRIFKKANSLLDEYENTKVLKQKTALRLIADYNNINVFFSLPKISPEYNFGHYTDDDLEGCLNSIINNLDPIDKIPMPTNNEASVKKEKPIRWYQFFPLFFGTYKFSLSIIGIILCLSPYIYEWHSVYAQWQNIQPNIRIAESILEDANSINIDSTENMGEINAIIKCFNDFYPKVDSTVKPLDTLNFIYDKIYTSDRNPPKAHDRIRYIKTTLKKYIKANSATINPTHSDDNSTLDFMLKIIGILINVAMLILASVQTRLMIKQSNK
jgi:hypothetical protein